MSFLSPKAPKVVKAPPPALPATQATTTPGTELADTGLTAPGSLVSTTPQGLTRKANTRRSSLLGGTSAT